MFSVVRLLNLLPIVVLASGLVAGSAQAAVHIRNGDFEALGGSLDHWTVTLSGPGSVVAGVAADYQSCCGVFGSTDDFSKNHFAAFTGDPGATQTLSQTLPNTRAGAHYALVFRLGAFGEGSAFLTASSNGSRRTMEVFANNDADTTFDFGGSGFMGSGGPQAVTFEVTTTSSNITTILDHVMVNAALPEPAAWALMLLGFGGLGVPLRRSRARLRRLSTQTMALMCAANPRPPSPLSTRGGHRKGWRPAGFDAALPARSRAQASGRATTWEKDQCRT